MENDLEKIDFSTFFFFGAKTTIGTCLPAYGSALRRRLQVN